MAVFILLWIRFLEKSGEYKIMQIEFMQIGRQLDKADTALY